MVSIWCRLLPLRVDMVNHPAVSHSLVVDSIMCLHCSPQSMPSLPRPDSPLRPPKSASVSALSKLVNDHGCRTRLHGGPRALALKANSGVLPHSNLNHSFKHSRVTCYTRGVQSLYPFGTVLSCGQALAALTVWLKCTVDILEDVPWALKGQQIFMRPGRLVSRAVAFDRAAPVIFSPQQQSCKRTASCSCLVARKRFRSSPDRTWVRLEPCSSSCTQ